MAQANAKFMAPKKIDADLAAVVGQGPMPAPEVIKALWAYIKANNLQDPNDKRTIVADEKLKKVFDGQAKVNMMKMAGFVFKHLS